jgi:hypothetical protein
MFPNDAKITGLLRQEIGHWRHPRIKIALVSTSVIKLFTAAMKYLRYWKYHLSFDDGEIFADIV